MFLIRNTIQRLFSLQNAYQGLNVNVNLNQFRSKSRYYLPNPTEVKRVRKQGFKRKLQTAAGRKILMDRILKGDKVIAQ